MRVGRNTISHLAGRQVHVLYEVGYFERPEHSIHRFRWAVHPSLLTLLSFAWESDVSHVRWTSFHLSVKSLESPEHSFWSPNLSESIRHMQMESRTLSLGITSDQLTIASFLERFTGQATLSDPQTLNSSAIYRLLKVHFVNGSAASVGTSGNSRILNGRRIRGR